MGGLTVQIQRRYHRPPVELAPLVAGHHPHNLELVAVRVPAVEGLRGPVIALADYGIQLGQ